MHYLYTACGTVEDVYKNFVGAQDFLCLWILIHNNFHAGVRGEQSLLRPGNLEGTSTNMRSRPQPDQQHQQRTAGNARAQSSGPPLTHSGFGFPLPHSQANAKYNAPGKADPNPVMPQTFNQNSSPATRARQLLASMQLSQVLWCKEIDVIAWQLISSIITFKSSFHINKCK